MQPLTWENILIGFLGAWSFGYLCGHLMGRRTLIWEVQSIRVCAKIIDKSLSHKNETPAAAAHDPGDPEFPVPHGSG